MGRLGPVVNGRSTSAVSFQNDTNAHQRAMARQATAVTMTHTGRSARRNSSSVI
jgi:hypothetical protein